jgi:hypothetical protein
VRVLVLTLIAVAQTAVAGSTKCPANAKRFECHALAVRAHLGVGAGVDLATAKALYADACAQHAPASCNNLAVLALMHPELAKDVDAKALFEAACNRLETVACDNARRLATHKELAVELALPGSPFTQGADRWHELERAACRAGDVFRCEDPASRATVAAALADECRSGTPTTCVDAATRTSDEPTITALLGLGCTAHDGKACHMLATRKAGAGIKDEALLDLWKGACSDNDFAVTDEDAAARSEACARWGGAARKRVDQLRAAELAAGYCTAGKASACAVGEQLYDRAGEHAKAFAIARHECNDDLQTPACRDVGERYVLGNGTAIDAAKGLDLLGGTCPKDLAWTSCKRIGRYLEGKQQALDAAQAYATYCDGGNTEACYLRARAIEADHSDASCVRKPSVPELKALYAELCTSKYQDSCRRSTQMCARAMADFFKPAACGGSGVGDGIERFDMRYHAVIELCPKPSWTPAVRKAMDQIDAHCRQFESSGGQCER